MSNAETESSDETIEPISPVMPVVKETKKKKSKKTLDNEIVENQEENKEVKKKGKGRPPKPIEEKLAKQVVVKEKIIYMVQNEKGEFEKAKNPKLTAKELKKIELEKQKQQKEIEEKIESNPSLILELGVGKILRKNNLIVVSKNFQTWSIYRFKDRNRDAFINFKNNTISIDNGKHVDFKNNRAGTGPAPTEYGLSDVIGAFKSTFVSRGLTASRSIRTAISATGSAT